MDIKIADTKYEIGDCFSQGGTANCHLLHHAGRSAQPTNMIIKILKNELTSSFKEYFEREYNIGKQLNNPYIAHYKYYLPEEGAIVIDYVDGPTLGDFLSSEIGKEYFNGENGNAHIFNFCEQVLNGIIAMHEKGIYHCDLKESNILLRRNSWQAVIIDLGMARTDGDNFTIGTTNAVCAPEMRKGHADGRSDIYMFGLLLKQVAEGQKNYAPIIRRCLQENASERYQSASELLEDIHINYCNEADRLYMDGLMNATAENFVHINGDVLYVGKRIIGMIGDLGACRLSSSYINMLMRQKEIQDSGGGNTPSDSRTLQKGLPFGLPSYGYGGGMSKQIQLLAVGGEMRAYERRVLDFTRKLILHRSEIDAQRYRSIVERFMSGDMEEAQAEYDSLTSSQSIGKEL
jgi:serine/threonine protein kinase